jgi:NADH-quinone oxidoreductase subunit M
VAALLIGFEDGTRSFDMALAPLTLPATVSHVVFWLCTGAFLLAMAVVPLHVPLLDLEEDSSGAVAAVFAALLPTLGAYGLLHVSVGLFPTISGDYSLLFAILAVVSVVWAGVAAFRADDLRRLVGYVGTVQMGAVLLAIAGHTTLAITGAIFLLLSRGLIMSVLMLLSSLIQERTRRVRISQIAGLAWQAPRVAALWLGAALGAAGTPILSGFVAYLLLFTGSFPSHRWLTLVVLVSVLLTPLALLLAAQRIFLGGARETFSKVRDLSPLDLTYFGVLLALIVLLGVLPEHFADLFANGASSILFPGTNG